MGKYDPSLCHYIVNGPSLRSSLHAYVTNALLYRSLELERVAGRAADKHARYVRDVNVHIAWNDTDPSLLVSSTRF